MNSGMPFLHLSPRTALSNTEAVELVHHSFARLRTMAAGIIVGLEHITEQIFITLICRGHCILEGVPGLAKIRLISTIATSLAILALTPHFQLLPIYQH